MTLSWSRSDGWMISTLWATLGLWFDSLRQHDHMTVITVRHTFRKLSLFVVVVWPSRIQVNHSCSNFAFYYYLPAEEPAELGQVFWCDPPGGGPGSTQDRHLTVPPDKFGWEREVWASALHLLPKDLALDKWRWVDNLAPVLLSACSWQWGLFQAVTVNWVSLFHISCRLIAPPDSSDWIRLAAPQKHKVWLSGWWGFFTGDKHVSRKDQKSDKTLSCLQCFIFAVETWSVFLDSQTQTDTFVLMFDGKFTEPGETTLLLRGYSRE